MNRILGAVFGFLGKREHSERRFVREEFEKMVKSLRTADPLTQGAVGHTINLANSMFHLKFGSLAKFDALPTSEKMAFVAVLTRTEELAAERNQPEAMIGYALYKKWIGAVAIGDKTLAQQFSDGLVELSRIGEFMLGPEKSEPLPAGFAEMTEEQRLLSAKFSREHKEREKRAAGTAVRGLLDEALRAYKSGNLQGAVELLQPLADNRDASAQYYLGVIYAEGQDRKAYDSAIAMGSAAAQKGISMQLKPQYRGPCMEPDFVLAYKWFSLSASSFTEANKVNRNLAVQRLEQVAAKMTRAQIAEAKTRAREWEASR